MTEWPKISSKKIQVKIASAQRSLCGSWIICDPHARRHLWLSPCVLLTALSRLICNFLPISVHFSCCEKCRFHWKKYSKMQCTEVSVLVVHHWWTTCAPPSLIVPPGFLPRFLASIASSCQFLVHFCALQNALNLWFIFRVPLFFQVNPILQKCGKNRFQAVRMWRSLMWRVREGQKLKPRSETGVFSSNSRIHANFCATFVFTNRFQRFKHILRIHFLSGECNCAKMWQGAISGSANVTYTDVVTLWEKETQNRNRNRRVQCFWCN